MAAKTQSCLIVAAFDVGTMYRGYAFSYRDDPLKVQTNQTWFSEGAGKFLSLKTPTSVLLNPDGKFDSFGLEAEDRYTNKAKDDKHHGWRLFRRFKMALHNDQQLSSHTTVDDIEGNPHKALPIFSMAIKFLQTHLLQVMSVEEKDISYVITVPAIWDDDAKEFMKTAATEAGLDETRVTLAPEPEAALIWCETLDVDTKAALAETGNQYMVIDLGDKRLILPEEAELAVLKGAVIFGYNSLVVVEKEKKYSTLLVAAFDFGTTYSGYAFSFKNDPLKVHTNHNWSSRTTGQLISLKTSTSVLLNPEGEFDSFGFEAEDSYASKAEDDEHEGWRLFRRFKMVLQNKVISRDTTVEDIEGNSHEALPIFAMAIKFLHEHFLKAVKNQMIGLLEEEISYVITLPAIWDDNAKEFMRTAAIEAGLDGTRVTLALEPEAASIWCETLDVDTRTALAGAGTQYMVIDLGGGTADVSVHEKNQDGTLKEIHQPSGGPWGGIYVDENYLKFLGQIFGEEAITALKNENMADYFDVIRGFETKKITLNIQNKGKFTFKISSTTKKLSKRLTGQKLEQRISNLGLLDDDSVTVKGGDKLRVEPDIVRTWFDGPLNNVIDHVKNLLKKPKLNAVQTVVLVGGFGENTYVQERLRAEIPDKRLVVPAEAGLTVLKGAVRFGHDPAIIASRVMIFTYGISVDALYDANIHSEDKKFLDKKGQWRVKNGFDVFVCVNKSIPIDHQITKGYTSEGYNFNIRIYRTAAENPVYTNEPGCELLGYLPINLPEDIPLSELNFNITFMFGGTELVVKNRVINTGKEKILKLNCLK